MSTGKGQVQFVDSSLGGWGRNMQTLKGSVCLWLWAIRQTANLHVLTSPHSNHKQVCNPIKTSISNASLEGQRSRQVFGGRATSMQSMEKKTSNKSNDD